MGQLDRTGLLHLLASLLVTASLVACQGTVRLPPKAIALNDSGAAALAAGDLTTAEARIALAIEYSPRFTEAWVNLGLIELRRGNVERAKHDFKKARELNPDLPSPHHALGLLFDAKGEGPEAEASYRAALKVDPGFAPSRANLARRLFARGALEEAREQFLRLTEVAPSQVEGWTGLVECYVKLDREGEGDDVLARARARLGDVPELTLLVARQMLRRGAYEEAEREMAPLTSDAQPTRRASAWGWIAVARAARSDTQGAILASSEALTLDRNQPVATWAMAVALTEVRDPTAARWMALARALASPGEAAALLPKGEDDGSAQE